MSGEIIAVLSVGVGLAVLLVGLFAWLRQEMAQLEARLQEEMARLEHGQARLEGLLEGLREAITGRAAAR